MRSLTLPLEFDYTLLALPVNLVESLSMATLLLPDVPDDLYARLQHLADEQNRSISAQAIALLEKALPNKVQQPQETTQQDLLEILAESRRRPRRNPADLGLPDSTELIREDRSR